MSAEHPNVTLVRSFYDALAALDLDAVQAMTDPDIEITQTPELPWGGEFRGHDGLGEFFVKLVGTISSKVTIATVFAAGDEVVQVGRTAGTVNATGAPFDVDEVHVLTIREGRIARFDARIDTPGMLAAIAAPDPT